MKNEFMFLLSCVAFASPCMSAQANFTKNDLERMNTNLTKEVNKLRDKEVELRNHNENARKTLAATEEKGRALLNLQKKLDALESSCAEKEGEYERGRDEKYRKIYEYKNLFRLAFEKVVNSVCAGLYKEFGVGKPDFFVQGDVVPCGDWLEFVYNVYGGKNGDFTSGDYKEVASELADYVADNLRNAMLGEPMGEVTLEEQKKMDKIMEREKGAVEKKKKELEDIIKTLDGAISSLNNFSYEVEKLGKLEFERLSGNISMVCGHMCTNVRYYVIIMDSDMAKKAFGSENAELIRRVMWQEDSKLTIRNDECGFLTYNQNGKEAFFSFKWIAAMLEKATQSLFRPNN